MKQNPIIVPLDGMTEEGALSLAQKIAPHVWGFKVNDLLVDCGLSIIKKLKSFGPVFADPKFYDIPNTVGNSVKKLATAGADLITIHASGGPEMIAKALEYAGRSQILCVTVLTSISDEESKSVYQGDCVSTVLRLAKVAEDAGSHGIVCSPKELLLLKEKGIATKQIKVVPGIRPAWHQKKDDQTRTKTPKDAIADGADFLVIGRPITEHADPVEACKMILDEIKG